jgi:ABC-type phosphonate transport system ATPase subunit
VGLVLDTGALIAFERGDRRVAALIEATRRRKDRVVTSSGCVAQAWRDGTRQALLARLLTGTAEHALGPDGSRHVGELCGATATVDVVDAHVALLAADHDTVVTSDPDDLRALLRASRRAAAVLGC